MGGNGEGKGDKLHAEKPKRKRGKGRYVKYFFIVIILTAAVLAFIRYETLKDLKIPKTWNTQIPYFKSLKLETCFYYSDFFSDDGRMLYKIYLEADDGKYDYRKIVDDGKVISIEFLNKDGFRIARYDLDIHAFDRIISEDTGSKVDGYSSKDFWLMAKNDYQAIKEIGAGSTVKFEILPIEVVPVSKK